MELKDRQIFERNKLAFKFGGIIQGFELISTVLYRADRVGWVDTIFMVICQVLIGIFFVISYTSIGRKRAMGKYLMMGALMASYFIVMLGSVHVPYLWAFGPGLLMLVLLFADVKLTLITAAVLVGINVLYIPLFIKFSVEVAARINMVMTDAMFILLIAFMAIFYVRLNSCQNQESLEEIEGAAAMQEEHAKTIQSISANIAKKLEDANDAMEGLSTKVISTAESAEQISQSINLTADAIQTQTAMNSNITESLDNIAHQSRAMLNNADEVTENISDGNTLVEELRVKSDETSKINEETAEMTSQLQESAGTVKDIVGTILNISSQTNLLALNASIEAARAGEAGKGFAVVADEIRALSEHTKESAEEISATIDDLISKVNTASLNMQRSVDSSSQQGELIVETGDKFKVILEKVSDLTRRASDISENVDSCVDANAKVMDAISNLSASSQEVAASAESSIHVSQDCETDMETTKNILHEILEISRSSENN